jgi:hypothetical protein
LGNLFTITLTGAPANAPASLFLSDNTQAFMGSPLPLVTSGGTVWLDPTLMFFIPTSANAIGSASFSLIVPSDPALRGLPAYWQWLITESTGLTVSGGLQTIIQ